MYFVEGGEDDQTPFVYLNFKYTLFDDLLKLFFDFQHIDHLTKRRKPHHGMAQKLITFAKVLKYVTFLLNIIPSF